MAAVSVVGLRRRVIAAATDESSAVADESSGEWNSSSCCWLEVDSGSGGKMYFTFIYVCIFFADYRYLYWGKKLNYLVFSNENHPKAPDISAICPPHVQPEKMYKMKNNFFRLI